MMRCLLLLLAGLVAGCATDGPAVPSTDGAALPAALASPALHDIDPGMPAIGEVQSVGTANVQRPITGSCGMESLQHHVGQPRITVDSRTLPSFYRVVGRYSRVTMEYRPDRLTIRIADDDTVESITCG